VSTRAHLLRIGQLARQAGSTSKTLRYYDEIGLLRPAARSASGYRLYGGEEIQRLRFVRRARGLGLSLADIQAILDISDTGRVPCEHVVAIVDRELGRIATQLERLEELRLQLLAMRSNLTNAIASGAARPGRACPCFQDGPS
jgi:DNA-binding transcriptional MerR regulator